MRAASSIKTTQSGNRVVMSFDNTKVFPRLSVHYGSTVMTCFGGAASPRESDCGPKSMKETKVAIASSAATTRKGYPLLS